MNNAWFADLETTGLSAKSGDIILCCAFLPLFPEEETGDKEYVLFGNSDVPDDGEISERIADFIMEHPMDAFYWWNGYKFDLPFLTERLRQHDKWPFAHPFQHDLKDLFKQQYPYLDGHLDTAAKAFGLDVQKTELNLAINRRCAESADDKEAWDSLIEHNIADIHVTREVYKKMYVE